MNNDEDPQCGTEPHDDESVFGGRMVWILYQQSMLVEEYCSGLLEGNAMLLGIRCRLAGIPFEGDLVHTYTSNTAYCLPQQGIFSANVPSDLSLLAFGIPPAREAESAGGMPKVPKGQGLGRLVCSAV